MLLTFSISNYCLFVKAFSGKYLPKTTDTSTKDKDDKKKDKSGKESDKTDNKNTTSSSGDLNLDKEEDETPVLTYKLIAIYLIGKEPRALIKNLEIPDELPKEYRVGEYVDELQKFSISKISFNPTARVELIDRDGLSYLIKPQISENKVDASGKGGLKPSAYSTGKIYKKRESDPAPSAPTAPAPQANTDKPMLPSQSSQKAEGDTVSKPQAADPSPSSSGVSQGGAQIGGTPKETPKSQDKPADSSENRPANPFQ